MNQQKWIPRLVVGLFIIVLISSFLGSMFLTIKPGQRGVVFRPFSTGLDKEHIYQPGFHLVAPWNKMHVYDVKEQQLEERMDALSSNGLSIKMDVTVRVNPIYERIGYLHEKFGKNYIESLVRPEIRSSVRKMIGRYTPEELYSTKRDELQSLIQKDLGDELKENNVQLQAVLIRSVELPQTLQAAIERKLKSEQESLEYEFRLQKERKEAERVIIQAKAKAEANRILSASLTDKILKDKGIDATLKLSESPNSKVVIVGGGKNGGLPLILGDQ
ncbi:MAG TPA: prohibitin family protein [Saprospiraceae bacterium]|nr:prohibitin family protein [Saprospiraceae bacterium]